MASKLPSRPTRILAGLAACAAALAWLVFRPQPLAVDTAGVARGDLEVTVDEEGETRVRQRYVVAAPISGRLLRIQRDEGDRLGVGDLVVRIEAAPLDPRGRAAAQARLEAAEAQASAALARVGLARATREQAQRTERRARSLHESGTLSAGAYEEAQLALTQAQRELEAAEEASHAASHEVEAAQAALIAAADTGGVSSGAGSDGDACAEDAPCVEVRAPVAGSVLRVLEESERTVAAGTPLIELGDAADLEIVVDVLSSEAVRIQPGNPASIEDWGGERPLRAVVRRVEPSAFTKISALGVEEQRVNVILDLEDEAPGLGDGYRVEARIRVWSGSDLVLVPVSALFRAGDAWAVFVVRDGVAHRREIEIGERGTAHAEVLAGLDEGETVVLHPSDRLEDGGRVRTY